MKYPADKVMIDFPHGPNTVKNEYVYLISVAEETDDFQYGDTILFCMKDANDAYNEAEEYKKENGGVYKIIRMELR